MSSTTPSAGTVRDVGQDPDVGDLEKRVGGALDPHHLGRGARRVRDQLRFIDGSRLPAQPPAFGHPGEQLIGSLRWRRWG